MKIQIDIYDGFNIKAIKAKASSLEEQATANRDLVKNH